LWAQSRRPRPADSKDSGGIGFCEFATTAAVTYFDDIDLEHPDLGDLFDELTLWSAPFGLLLLDRVPMKRGMTILDVGAGTGFLTVELAQRCGEDSRVIAADPWKPVMGRLRRKVEYLGLANVMLLEQDAAALDLPAASVDLVVSNLGVNNFENAEAVLRACRRVLRPEGRLLLTTNLVGHMKELYDVYRETLIELGRDRDLPALEAHVSHRATVDSLGRLLESTGFERRAVDLTSFRMRFADGTSLLRHHFIRLGFVPGWRSVVPTDDVPVVFASLERNLNALAAREGCLTLTVPGACVEAAPVPSASIDRDEGARSS
jgi:arsenite methyltransferase